MVLCFSFSCLVRKFKILVYYIIKKKTSLVIEIRVVVERVYTTSLLIVYIAYCCHTHERLAHFITNHKSLSYGADSLYSVKRMRRQLIPTVIEYTIIHRRRRTPGYSSSLCTIAEGISSARKSLLYVQCFARRRSESLRWSTVFDRTMRCVLNNANILRLF